jgi:hypothetical protein
MTNSYTKIVLLAVSVLAVALTGCKKDEDESFSFTLDATSMDFEWGQTKEVTFTSINIKKFGTPTAPEGWKCVRDGHKYIITAPATGGTATGKIELPVTSKSGASLTRSITVAVRLATEISVAANSVIISEPAKRFKFNALKRGGEAAAGITGAASATRVWATASNVVVNVSLENGYLYFATGNAEQLVEGNAVVAVLDKDGNALWSWHIWVTEYDPAEEPDVVGNFRVMNRNLGASANSDASGETAAQSYGLYYQWGRKEPFVGPVAWDSTTPVALYNNSGSRITHDYVASDKETGTVEYAIAHPGTFIAGAEANDFDWLFSAHKTDLWSPSAKTLYDPCPAGWRVAPPTIWRDFTTTGNASGDPEEFNVESDYKYGWKFVVGEQTMFYPAAGRHSFSPTLATSSTNFTNVVNDDQGVGYPVGFYWSGAHPSSAAGALVFRHDYINPAGGTSTLSDYATAGGFPLRCVAE